MASKLTPNNLYMANTSHLSSDLSLLHTPPILYRPKLTFFRLQESDFSRTPMQSLQRALGFLSQSQTRVQFNLSISQKTLGIALGTRENMSRINSWKWVPEWCDLNQVGPTRFLGFKGNKNIGFVGDSLNENFVVSFLCIFKVADAGAKKWKRKGACRGAYFPKFNVTVAYHLLVLLAKYEWQPQQRELFDRDGVRGTYRVDVDIPADDWANIADFLMF